jgi:ABC-type transporter Mla subunit MlaD
MTTTQNLISLTLTDAQLHAVDQALSDLEAQLTGLVAMTTAQRRKLARMGDKSEAFCRQTLSMLAQNPQVVPATLNVADAVSDLQALDRLRPRMQRITRLAERASDTEIALGSDVMRCALDGYAILKVAGRNQGLEGLRRGLGTRFAKSPRMTESEPA